MFTWQVRQQYTLYNYLIIFTFFAAFSWIYFLIPSRVFSKWVFEG